MVALRKESVDRNLLTVAVIAVLIASLSARRAWIEIILLPSGTKRKRSLSARRAWIEISAPAPRICTQTVALRKESVDRNFIRQHTVISNIVVALRKESVDRNCLQPLCFYP